MLNFRATHIHFKKRDNIQIEKLKFDEKVSDLTNLPKTIDPFYETRKEVIDKLEKDE